MQLMNASLWTPVNGRAMNASKFIECMNASCCCCYVIVIWTPVNGRAMNASKLSPLKFLEIYWLRWADASDESLEFLEYCATMEQLWYARACDSDG